MGSLKRKASIMTLRETMLTHQATARAGNPDECREPIVGFTVQNGGMRAEGWFSRHVVVVDEPKVFGGEDSAANPAEVLLAALTFAFVTSVTPGPNNVMLTASGAKLTVADVDKLKSERARREFGAAITDINKIAETDCEVTPVSEKRSITL